MKALEFIFSSFWVWLGTALLLGTVLKFFFVMWNRFLRSFTLRKHGYPPPHCDADGDFKSEPKEEDDSNG